METSIPGYDHLDDDSSSFLDITKNNSRLGKSNLTQSISNIQPIKPWSAPVESYKTQNDLWEEVVANEASNNNENPIEEESSTWEFSANPDIETNEDAPETQTEDSVTDEEVNHHFVDEEIAAQEVVSPSDSSELGEQLDSVIQTFFASHTESELPQPPLEQDAETSETLISPWEPMVEPSKTNDDDNIDTSQSSDYEDEQMTTFSSSVNENNTYELEDYWEEVSHFPAFDVTENDSSFETLSETDSHSNSPSPLIYPKRPSKGRKSFASVELPKFNQKKDEDKS